MARKALLVGINEYPGAPLRGCINDCYALADRLLACGWERKDIRLLTDKRATTAAITDRLHWVAKIKPGDQAVFGYSGHGAIFTTRDYLSGSVARSQDCICPVDFDWSRKNAILAGDFANIFKNIPDGASLTWISDSCHSGDLTRVIVPVGCDIGTYRAPRSYPIPADIAWRGATAAELGLQTTGLARAIEHLKNAVLLAGCKSDQTSADAFIDGRYCGAFSYAYQHIMSQPGGDALPIGELVASANKWLADNGYEQDPQAKGDPDHVSKPWLWVEK